MGMKKAERARRYPPTPDQVGVATAIPVMGMCRWAARLVASLSPFAMPNSRLQPDGQVYAAALCANYDTGELSEPQKPCVSTSPPAS